MSQATLDDDDLFGEAAGELKEDVESHLADGWEALPDAEAIWDAEADNVLGVLNTLRSNLDIGDAKDHLREAKKWYALAERADAIDGDDELGESVEALQETIEDIEVVREGVADVASTLPALRDQLEDAAPEEAEPIEASE